MSSGHHHAIKIVSQRTGLSAHVIRIWERRYGAVKPDRTDTKRRLYSEEQIERLKALKDLTEQGHSIGNIARLSREKLQGLLATSSRHNPSPTRANTKENDFLQDALAAVRNLDASALEAALKDANLSMGAQALALRVIGPLAEKIGELWRDGSISAAHEHFATAVIRVFLGHTARQFTASTDGPTLVVVTPLGQLHELGALLVALTAANLGWNVKYLGASLPAAEIAGVARQTRARAVALSIVYPEDDARLENELNQLRDLLGRDIAILAGGRAAPAYREWLNRIDAKVSKDIKDFSLTLDALRRRR